MTKTIAKTKMQYYDIKANWKKIKKALETPECRETMVEHMFRFTFGRWRHPFLKTDFPADHESCDWDFDCGPRLGCWKYVKHAACYNTVSFNWLAISAVEPNEDWRIIISDKHATCWNMKPSGKGGLIFDINFYSMKVPIDQCCDMIFNNLMDDGKVEIPQILPRDVLYVPDWDEYYQYSSLREALEEIANIESGKTKRCRWNSHMTPEYIKSLVDKINEVEKRDKEFLPSVFPSKESYSHWMQGLIR